MNAPENQSNLSNEEMLKAAKRVSSKDPSKPEQREVIVQEDGTKVVRVKRRKKKSSTFDDELLSSTEAEKTFYFKFLIWSLLALLLLALLVVGIIFFRVASLNQPNEISKLESEAAKAFSAEASIHGYRVGFKQVKASKISLSSAEESPAKFNFTVSNISAPLLQERLLIGDLVGDTATASNGVFRFDSALLSQPTTFSRPWDLSFQHNTIQIDKADLLWGLDGAEKRLPGIIGSEVRVRKRLSDELYISMRGGQVKNYSVFPPQLESAMITFTEEEVLIDSFKLSDGEAGTLEASGKLAYADSSHVLDAEIKLFKLEKLNDHLARILTARVSGEQGSVQINLPEKTFAFNTKFKASESGFTLKRLQFLTDIQTELGILSQPEVTFTKLSLGSLTVENRGYIFSNLNFEGISEIALRGSFLVGINGVLDGKLEVGISIGKLHKSALKVNTENLPVTNGFVWIPVTVSGSTEKPKDDFLLNLRQVINAAR